MTGKRNIIHVRCRIYFFNFFETKYCPFAIVIILFEDLPSLFGCFFFCPETAVERIEPLWMKLENSICKLIHGVKCYVLSLEQIIEWHLDVAKIVLYLFFKSQLLQLVRQTKIINLVPLALLATKCQNSQEPIKSRSNFKAKCRFGSFLHVGLYWIGGRSRPSYLFRKGLLCLMAMASLTLRLMVLFGQLHSLAKPPGPFLCPRIKEHQSPNILTFSSIARPQVTTSTHPM